MYIGDMVSHVLGMYDVMASVLTLHTCKALIRRYNINHIRNKSKLKLMAGNLLASYSASHCHWITT